MFDRHFAYIVESLVVLKRKTNDVAPIKRRYFFKLTRLHASPLVAASWKKVEAR